MHACNHMTRSGPCAHGVATCGHGSGTHSGRRDSAHRVYARGSAMARRRGPRASPVPGCLSPRNPICVFRRLDLAPLVLDTRRGGLSQITQKPNVSRSRTTRAHTNKDDQSSILLAQKLGCPFVYCIFPFRIRGRLFARHATHGVAGFRSRTPTETHTWPSERWCPLRWPQQ